MPISMVVKIAWSTLAVCIIRVNSRKVVDHAVQCLQLLFVFFVLLGLWLLEDNLTYPINVAVDLGLRGELLEC